MRYDPEEKVLRAAIRKYGTRAQMVVALEELSELQKEICKALRGQLRPAAMAEEIADAEIMLRQLVMMLENGQAVAAQRRRKVLRLQERIED